MAYTCKVKRVPVTVWTRDEQRPPEVALAHVEDENGHIIAYVERLKGSQANWDGPRMFEAVQRWCRKERPSHVVVGWRARPPDFELFLLVRPR